MAKDDTAEKTEEATPKKLEDSREQGQVAMSTEFMSAAGLIVGAISFVVGGGKLASTIAKLLAETFSGIGQFGQLELTEIDGTHLMKTSLMSVVGALAMVMAPSIIAATAIGYAQAGLRIASDAVGFDPSKIDPIKGAGRLFGMKSVVRTAMAAAKIFAIGGAMVLGVRSQINEIVRLSGLDLGPFLSGAGGVVLRIVAPALLVILVLATIDLIYQRWQHAKDQRMSKQEIKEETKQADGDPHVKARIRQVQRELATRRMMDDVPDATVIVTNPTHYAVALKYDRGSGTTQGAPRCVAKGVDLVAQRIKKIARENGVPLIEDVPLARGLYANMEVGDEIPDEFFQAVATMLGYVYRMEDSASTV